MEALALMESTVTHAHALPGFMEISAKIRTIAIPILAKTVEHA